MSPDARVLVLVKVPGWMPVKTRLVPALGEAGAVAVYHEMLGATMALARGIDPLPTVAFSPPGADAERVLGRHGPARWLGVDGRGGGECLEQALDRVFDGRPVVALGCDAPDLPLERLRSALAALQGADAVFVPTGDGGFSALALGRPVPGLAGGFSFGAGDALSSLALFFESRGLRVQHLEPWPDVDTPSDLAAWRAREHARSDPR